MTWRTSKSTAAWVGVLLAVLGVSSLTLALNAWAFDAAKWSEGERRVARG